MFDPTIKVGHSDAFMGFYVSHVSLTDQAFLLSVLFFSVYLVVQSVGLVTSV